MVASLNGLPTLKENEFGALVCGNIVGQGGLERSWLESGSQDGVVIYHSLNALRTALPKSFSVVLVAPPCEELNEKHFSTLFELLMPGGSIILINQKAKDELLTSLLLAGFTDSKTSISNGSLVVQAQKPNYEADAVVLASRNKSEKIWKINASDFNDNDYELEDEDELLEGEELDMKTDGPLDDCGPSKPGKKKRACKNCVCGLKELEEAEENEEGGKTVAPNPSACGNCSKGDAFRCASCPYLGTPSFEYGTRPEIKINKDGSKVLLDMQNEAL